MMLPKTTQERIESLRLHGWQIVNQGELGAVFISASALEVAVVLADGSYYRGHIEAEKFSESSC